MANLKNPKTESRPIEALLDAVEWRAVEPVVLEKFARSVGEAADAEAPTDVGFVLLVFPKEAATKHSAGAELIVASNMEEADWPRICQAWRQMLDA